MKQQATGHGDYASNYTKVGALRAYDDGAPSCLSDGNKWKRLVEEHRWGRHQGDRYSGACPVCERERNKYLRSTTA